MRLFHLLLPAVALASIEVKVGGKVYFDEKYIQGTFTSTGFEKRDLTDHDKAIFQIQDEDLKLAIETYYGKKPDQVFLTPVDTPWGNLYEMLAVDPIKVKIEAVIPINMIAVKNEKIELTRTTYMNDQKKNVSIQESDITYDTVFSIWSYPTKISASAVSIRLNFDVEKDVTSIDHAFSFGLNTKTEAKKVWRRSGYIDMEAGQTVIGQFDVKKGTLKIEIPYKVSLTGSVTVHYKKEYKKSHFHQFDINRLLENKTLSVFQTLSYEFYYGPTYKMVDSNNGHTILNSSALEGVPSGSQIRRASAAEPAAETGELITKKVAIVPLKFTDEDLKAIVQEPLQNQLDEESGESTEQKSAEQTENKTQSEVPKSE